MHRPLPKDDLSFVLDRAAPLWEELRGAHVLIAGGTGFFGRWLAESLLAAEDAYRLNLTVTVLARRSGFLQHPKLAYLAGDVRDFDFPRETVTHVVHLATDATLEPIPANADQAVDTLVNGTRRLLRLAAECGARKFLLASSGAVYGPQPEGMDRIPEEYAGGPLLDHAIAPYAEGKRTAEVLVKNAERFDATIARAFAFVGPGLPLDAHFAVGNFLRDGLANRPVEIRGDGTAVRSYLYAADLAVWLLTILLRGEGGRAYNVGSERETTVQELAAKIASMTGVETRTASVATARPTSHRYVPDTFRARHELGLEDSFPLEDALRRTLQYHHVKEPLHA